jgi:hypothetical protein
MAVTSIAVGPYRHALGSGFDALAPALIRHCDLRAGQSVTIEGRMDAWSRFPILRLFIPFMPRPATGVRAVVTNRGVLDAGELCYETVRTFYNPDGVAESYTLTRPHVEAPAKPWVLDTFNKPANIAVSLAINASDGGQALRMVTGGPQYALFGTHRLRLPALANVGTLAIERALDAQTIQIDVTVTHALLGRLFGYSGILSFR